jgi:hypothetical protein
MSEQITVYERCMWIVDYLRGIETDSTHRTIRHIWEAGREPKGESGHGGLGDTASLPTYHRTIAKLVRQGQLEEAGIASDGATLYRAAAQLSPFNTYTLNDLNAALWELSAAEALALYLDAVDYYESRAHEVLAKAATQLLGEDPRKLVLEMLHDRAAELEEDIGILQDSAVSDRVHHAQTKRRLEDLRYFVNSEIGINPKTWTFQSFEALEQGEEFRPPNWNEVASALDEHVFGSHFIEQVAIPPLRPENTAPIVAGSDGSSHVGYVRGVPAPQYVEEEGRLLLTFNNSIAYIDLPKGYPHKVNFPYHGVPMTRAAIEDPGNRGMIISRPWFDDLTDSKFEHMKKAALDVVQYRVDERLISGVARAYGSSPAGADGGLLPRPNVLIRDGTVTPQEREFQHYCDRTSYGDVVREGIALSYNILRAVKESESRIYAGAVKFTQMKTFSKIVNWYIKRRVDESWDLSKASHVSDSAAVTRLLTSLPPVEDEAYYRTCIIVRPFPALVTDFRFRNIQTEQEWLDYFRQRRDVQQREYEEHGGETSWLVGQELADDPYVRMCQQADYAAFYFGKPAGDPQVTLPRFEFMDSLRPLSPERREKRISQAADLIMTGIHVTKWSLDREHNFLTQHRMPRLIPYVVYEAHEKCKALGHKLESELVQAITMRLSQLKALRGLPVPKIDIEPVSVKRYLSGVRERLLSPGDRKVEDNFDTDV